MRKSAICLLGDTDIYSSIKVDQVFLLLGYNYNINY